MSHGSAILVAMAASALVAAAAEAGSRIEALPARVRTVDVALRRLVPFGFSGAIAITHRGRTLLASGYGSRRDGSEQAIGVATGFDIGSLSKTFTALGILRLAEQGRLSLSDTLGAFFPGAPADKRGITLARVLTHTAGFPAFHDTSGDFESMTAEVALERILGASLEPEAGFHYSNSGYSLLALVIEKVTEERFEAWMGREVFGRAGMKRTGFYADARWRDSVHLARGSIAGSDEGSPADWVPKDRPIWGLLGNGGVVSTVADLAAFDRAVRGNALLGRVARAEWFAARVEAEGGGDYGYGWEFGRDSLGGEVVGHGGSNDFGFACRFARFPRHDLTVVLLLNHQPEEFPDIAIWREVVMRMIVRCLLQGGTAGIPDAMRPDSRARSALAGTWRLPDSSTITITPVGSRLVATSSGGSAARGFAGVDGTQAATLHALDERAERMMQGVLAGDGKLLFESLGDSARYRRSIAYLTRTLERVAQEHGPVEAVRVTATIPRWWEGSTQPATLVRIMGRGHVDYLRIHWDARSRLVGFGGAAIREGPSAFLGQKPDGSLVGYSAAIGVELPMRAEGARLTVTTPAGELQARRTN